MHNFTMTVKQNTNTSLLMQTKMATGNDYLSEKKLWPFLQIIRHTIVVEEWALAHRHFLKTCKWDPRGLALGPAPNPRARGRPSTLILGHDITNKRLSTIFLALNFFLENFLFCTSLVACTMTTMNFDWSQTDHAWLWQSQLWSIAVELLEEVLPPTPPKSDNDEAGNIIIIM